MVMVLVMVLAMVLKMVLKMVMTNSMKPQKSAAVTLTGLVLLASSAKQI